MPVKILSARLFCFFVVFLSFYPFDKRGRAQIPDLFIGIIPVWKISVMLAVIHREMYVVALCWQL